MNPGGSWVGQRTIQDRLQDLLASLDAALLYLRHKFAAPQIHLSFLNKLNAR